MESIRASVRERLHLREKAENSIPPSTQELPNAQTPPTPTSKRKATVQVKQLENTPNTSTPSPPPAPPPAQSPLNHEANPTPATPTPHAAPEPPPTLTQLIPSLPILTTAPTLTPPCPLLNLPPDLIHLLTTHLPWNSLLALRSTCRPLAHLLCSNTLTLLRHNLILSSLTHESLALASYRATHPRSPQGHLWDLFYAAFEWQLLERPARALRCYGCLEVKGLEGFVERMSSRGTGLGGRRASQRRCKDCLRRRGIGVGVWWREHWVRKRDVRRRMGRGERVREWLVGRGRGQGGNRAEVKPGEEVGVCCVCRTGQFELFWGCAGCFEKEEERRRRAGWDALGLRDGEGEEVEGWVRWVLERADQYRKRKEKRRRRRYARRAEGGAKWWSVRRWVAWVAGDENWNGSWGERVEALVEYLHGPEYQLRRRRRNADAAGADADEEEVAEPHIRDDRQKGHGERADENEEKREWKASDQLPIKKDRRETRCCMCWAPTTRPSYSLGLMYEPRLSLDRCCDDCQQEEAERKLRRRKRQCGKASCDGEESDDGVEYVQTLFGVL